MTVDGHLFSLVPADNEAPRSATAFAVLKSCNWALRMDDSVSSAKSTSFSKLAGYRLD